MTDHGLKPPAASADATGGESPIFSGVVAPVVMPIIVPVVAPVAGAPVVWVRFAVQFPSRAHPAPPPPRRGATRAQLARGTFAAQLADATVGEFELFENVYRHVIVPIAHGPDHRHVGSPLLNSEVLDL